MEDYFDRKGWILFYCNEGDSLSREKTDLEHHDFHEYNVGRIEVMDGDFYYHLQSEEYINTCLEGYEDFGLIEH